ncbi:ankyrin repeat [Fusarium heterosporum]|uniref:Ankyrin repeat n=1 Tax=Fusarium heterosporum TaxID=42747 RepID=A0A8H5WRI2_FUSHE|nr:ankyrin repeat [Fusarium heterosporum]
MNLDWFPFTVLLAHGANINATGVDGMTPLHIAALYNSEDVVDYLLKEQTMDQFAKDSYDRFPVHLVASKCHVKIIKGFRESIDEEGPPGITALHYAIWNEHADTINELVS